MTDIRSELHEEVDRMNEQEMLGLKEYLASYPSRLAAFFRNARWDDEPVTEEDRLAIAEADEWLKQDGGEGIPHEEICRRHGLGRFNTDDENRMGTASGQWSSQAD